MPKPCRIVSAVTESRPKPCFTITAVTETKNIASFCFGAVTETETEFPSVSGKELTPMCISQHDESKRPGCEESLKVKQQ